MPQSRILVVDDDRLILSTLGTGLRHAGYEVYQAASGEEALDCVENLTISLDLAIVDISMPGISGIELAHRLADRYGIPSLFLSAFSDRSVVDEAVTSGGVGYLVKPVDVAQLIPAVEAALARARDLNSLLKHKEHLERALKGGREINVCIGILMERRGLTERDAFEVIRRQARSRQMKVQDVASQLLASEEMLNKTDSRH